MGRLPQVDTRGAATFIIAAPNSYNKNRADFIIKSGSVNAEQVINKAIDMLPAAGGKIRLLEGSYIVSAPIQLKDYTFLHGLGDTSRITIPDGLNADINIIENIDSTGGNSYIFIEDLRIDLNKVNQTSGTMKGIYFDNIARSDVASCQVHNATENGIHIEGGSRTRIRDNNCHDNDGSGLLVTNSGDAAITGNYAYNNGNHGIELDNLNQTIFCDNNLSYNNSVSGIVFANSDRGALRENSCRDNGDKGIVLYQAHKINVNANYCHDNGTFGINTIQSDHGIFNGNSCIANTESGFVIDNCEGDNIENNKAIENQQHGFWVISSLDCNMVGNLSHGNSQAASDSYDNIRCTGTAGSPTSNNMIQCNSCRHENYARYGLYMGTNTDHNQITNNDLLNSGLSDDLQDNGTLNKNQAGNRV